MLDNGGQRERALAAGAGESDLRPVVKLFTPDADCVWLLTSLDPEDTDLAYGLCDLGMGWPELADVRISELEAVRGKRGLPVEIDRRFAPDKTLKEYAEEARAAGRVCV